MLGTIFAVFVACFVLERIDEVLGLSRLVDMLRFRDVHHETRR